MQNINYPIAHSTPAKGKEEAPAAPQRAKPHAPKAASFPGRHIPQGWLRRMLSFLKPFFFPSPKQVAVQTYTPAKPMHTDNSPLPLAFRGGTAITLATPMGAYAGKPAQQRMRKLAEQQFHHMDVTQATKN